MTGVGPGGKAEADANEAVTTPPHQECTARQLRNRRAASWRLQPLNCGCPTGPHADPLGCLCTPPPLSEHALDGWRDAAEHLLSNGETPLLPLEVRRGLWRRGGRERRLAELLHRACGQVAS
jgi:hypothetical protein